MRSLNHLDNRREALRGNRGDATNGAFLLTAPTKAKLWVIASDGGGWDHVSVSCMGVKRLPTWPEMAYVKVLFFDAEDAVMELHPPQSDYVNNWEVLHLWRPQFQTIPLPPAWMVGVKGLKLARA
ncbi:MAG TPA: hypothetical protein VGH74_07735 [Planctomycetaceae bacterium]|jgi:hypothetical protein